LISLGEEWQITPSDTLMQQLSHLLGPGQVKMRYGSTPNAIGA
jgi:hypothetical protein